MVIIHNITVVNTETQAISDVRTYYVIHKRFSGHRLACDFDHPKVLPLLTCMFKHHETPVYFSHAEEKPSNLIHQQEPTTQTQLISSQMHEYGKAKDLEVQ